MKMLILDVWQPDCPIVSLSEKIEESKIYIIMPHVRGDTTRVFFTVEDGDIKEVLEVLRTHREVKQVKVLWKDNLRIGMEVLCNTTDVMDNLLRSHVVFQRSFYASAGFERWVVVVEDKNSENEILSRLKERNEIKIRERQKIREFGSPMGMWLMMNPASYFRIATLLDNIELSNTQKNILKTALESGYYQYPRRINLEGIAKKSGVSKTTVLKNLREIESLSLRILFSLMEITDV
ncbi:helix-turn-helix domain-containing protein [Thermococcus sp.]